MKTEQTNQPKPISFGFEASSWNYGCFYPSDSYKPKRDKSKELTAPINRNYYKDEPRAETAKPSFLKSNTLNKYGKRVLTKDEKIIQDSQVQNMNHLKRINTSKNISDKPTYINDKSQIQGGSTANAKKNGSLLSDVKNLNRANNHSKMKRSDSLSQSNQKNSAARLGVTYEEWNELKKEEFRITKAYQRMAEENKEALEQKKQEIVKQYEPTKKEIIDKWKEAKKTQMQADIEMKKRQEQEKLIKKLQRKKESEVRIDVWLKNQAQKIEMENRIKEELEKEKQEKRKKEIMNEETKQILRKKCFEEWVKKKEVEMQLNSSSNDLSKTDKRDRKSKLNLIIGPYSFAKDLREVKKIKEAYQDQGESENNCDEEMEYQDQEDQGQDNEQIEEEEVNEGHDNEGNDVNEAEAEYYAKQNQADDEGQYEEFEDGTEGNYAQKHYDFYDERNKHFNNISNI